MQLQTKDQLMSTTGSWAKQGLQKSHTTSREILGLHNCAVPDKGSIDKAGIKKSRTTLGEIVGLHNCAVANITLQQRLKCKEMDGVTNVMITYDATKIDGAYSDGIINTTPLFH